MPLAVKATFYPVVGIEDNLTWFWFTLNVVCQLQIELTSVLEAVPGFSLK